MKRRRRLKLGVANDRTLRAPGKPRRPQPASRRDVADRWRAGERARLRAWRAASGRSMSGPGPGSSSPCCPAVGSTSPGPPIAARRSATSSKTGVVGPAFFHERGATGFLRNFFAGLLTTAGLSNTGGPCEADGAEFGLHGRISNIPAEDVGVSQQWVGDDYQIRVAGTVRQATVFGESLILRREISTRLGANALIVRDTVENGSFRPEPLLLLYHCNFGYPIVSAATSLHTTTGSVAPRDGNAAAGLAKHREFGEPQPGYVEQCFYHRPKPRAAALMRRCSTRHLELAPTSVTAPTRCRCSCSGRCSASRNTSSAWSQARRLLDGRAELLRRNEAPMLAPGESRSFEVEIGVLENASARRVEVTAIRRSRRAATCRRVSPASGNPQRRRA